MRGALRGHRRSARLLHPEPISQSTWKLWAEKDALAQEVKRGTSQCVYKQHGVRAARLCQGRRDVFSVTEKQGEFEWTGTDNALVATEYVEDDTCKLYVKKTLPREEVDALVALWCCRVWRHSATTNPAVDHGMEGGKYTDPLGLNSY